MYWAALKPHVAPPPVKVAVIVPVPVALGPEKTLLGATRMGVLVPVMAEVTVSVPVIVWLPAVFSVALKVPTPLVSVAFAGSTEAPSLLEKCTVPAYDVAVLLN
jgi:type IV secretory pathway TrbD component